MTIAAGVDMGRRMRVAVERNFNSAGAGNVTRISLARIPSRVGKLKVFIRSFEVRIPTPTFDIATGKNLDLTSLSQLMKQFTLRLASGAPPIAAGVPAAHIEAVDGYRLLNTLAWMTGRDLVVAPSQLVAAVGPGAGVGELGAGTVSNPFSTKTDPTAIARVIKRGWTSRQGPFGNGKTAAVQSFHDSIRFIIPVGSRYGWGYEDNVIDAGWYSGDWCGCGKRTDSGSFEFTLGSSIDNQPITYDTDNFDLFVNAVLLPDDAIVCPTLPVIRTFDQVSGAFQTMTGNRSLLTITKPLTAAGAEQTSTFSTLTVRCAGDDLVDQTVTEAEVDTYMRADDDAHGPDADDFPMAGQMANTTSNAAQARLTNPGLILLAHRGDPRFAPGSAEFPTYVTPVVGDATYSGVDATWSVTDANVIRATAGLNGRADAVATPITPKGRIPHPEVAHLFPQRLIAPTSPTPAKSLAKG